MSIEDVVGTARELDGGEAGFEDSREMGILIAVPSNDRESVSFLSSSTIPPINFDSKSTIIFLNSVIRVCL